MTKIKICGTTNKHDAILASQLGADMLGFIFYKKSKRYVEPNVAEDIVNELPPYLLKVGVFVDEDAKKVAEIAQDAGLNALQFHGDETPRYCASFKDKYKVIKAFRLKDKASLQNINTYDVDYYLLDTYKKDSQGGTGEAFDWKMIEDFEFLKPVILSGGLRPDTVGKAIKALAPYGVDVTSGIEASPGRKDEELLKKFISNVRKAD
jgi:phosphoribosylanthranilate isomerase